MGAGVSRSGKGKLSLNLARVTRRRKKSTDKSVRLDVVYMSRVEVEDILTESSQKIGSYILYEDLDKQKMFLALKRMNGQVSHHFIHCYNDLYYFDDFPFPYIESIILYYSKHKFKDTKFTQQAFLDPFLSTGQKSIRRQLADNRRQSGSTNSAASSYLATQKPLFRKVDPDHEWSMSNVLTSLEICEDDEYSPQDDDLGTDYRKGKTFVASTPNIMFECEYGQTSMYLPNISRRYDYQESNADSNVTPESQFSSRVTIDSDSGYAVSVSNVKSKQISKDRRNKKKPHVASSFRILSESPNESEHRSFVRDHRGLLKPPLPNDSLVYNSIGREKGLLEPPSPADQSYVTRL